MQASIRAAVAPSGSAADTCSVAVVIPAYGHSNLLPEAIESVLRQDFPGTLFAVVVNDGCPDRETHAVARAYAMRYPGRVHAVSRANGGLSAARNTGVEFALTVRPDLDFVYFLDADNRLQPHAIRAFAAGLAGNPGAAWCYSDITNFGLTDAGVRKGSSGYTINDLSGEYSALLHLTENICEAGSMVRADLFREGLRFDEAMRDGYEDWDFWLQALERGHRGVHLSDSGFLYRRRPESMLSDSNRMRAVLIHYLTRKHDALFSTRNILRWAERDVPRYAWVRSDDASAPVVIFSDPRRPPLERLDVAEWSRRHVAVRHEPRTLQRPAFVLFAPGAAMEQVLRSPFARFALWQLETLLSDCELAFLEIGHGEEYEVEVSAGPAIDGETVAHAQVCAIASTVLDGYAAGPADELAAVLRGDQSPKAAVRLALKSPGIPPAPPALPALLDGIARVRDAAARTEPVRWSPKDNSLMPRQRLYQKVKQMSGVGGGALLPVIPEKPCAAVVMPETALERLRDAAEVNGFLARCRRTHELHAVLLARGRLTVPEWLTGRFDDLHVFVSGNLFETDRTRDYLGRRQSWWAGSGDYDRRIGLLAPMDFVLNLGACDINGMLGRLKKNGVQTWGVAAEGLLDERELEMFLDGAGAYEYAYAGFFTDGALMNARLNAAGVAFMRLHSFSAPEKINESR